MAYFFDFEQDYTGLDPNKIDNMLSMYGLNTYTKAPSAIYGSSYADVLLSPSVLLMFIAGVLCFFGAGVGLGITTILLVGLYIFAELYFRKKSDEQLDDIEASTAMKFRVIRGGKLVLVEKEFIVPDDLIVVQAGERVPADAFILESRDLTVDEYIFSGSRQPAPKYAGAISKNSIKPTFVYSGTDVISGIAICKVSATGVDTKVFQHRGEVEERHPYYTRLERIVRKNIPIFSGVGVALTLFLTIFKIANGGDIVPSAISGIVVGLCFIPAGAASLIRLYYTKGAMTMIKYGAMMKSFADIEKLNSLTVLCVEKEGAISKNSLEIRGIYARSEELLYKVAALSFDKNTVDPAERALMVKATFFDDNIANVYRDNEFVEKIPDLGGGISGSVWVVGGEKLCCVKGTPEHILPLCKLDGETMFEAKKRYEGFYANGCSVMAIACVDANSINSDVTAGFSYTFVGLIAFSAPLRDSVSSAVKTCRRSGVRVVMLTEDNPGAAASTGGMIGLISKTVVTGEQIDNAVETGGKLDLNADIYAKLSPEQKVYIIERLKANGEVVAMTGTRTGDVNALEVADVGITIAQHASGSSYETSDIVMNDDNFLSIADMIARARQIHRNIKRAFCTLISGSVGMILLTAMNIAFGLELMLTPAVIAALGLIVFPLAATVFIYNNADIRLNNPPSEFISTRKLNLPYLGRTALFGALAGAVATISYMIWYSELDVGYSRSCAFISFMFCALAFVVLRFSDSDPFRTFWSAPLFQRMIVIGTAAVSILLIYIPTINKSFGFTGAGFGELMISIVLGLLPAVIYFFVKKFIVPKFSYENIK